MASCYKFNTDLFRKIISRYYSSPVAYSAQQRQYFPGPYRKVAGGKSGDRHGADAYDSHQSADEHLVCRAGFLDGPDHERYQDDISRRYESIYTGVYQLQPHYLQRRGHSKQTAAYQSPQPVPSGGVPEIFPPYYYSEYRCEKSSDGIAPVRLHDVQHILGYHVFSAPQQG